MSPRPLQIALTIDDAPSVFEPGEQGFDAARMDRIREAVQAAGIRHCVAFAIGARAQGQSDSLRRWLAAGFELGNHTQDHAAASAVGPERFLESVAACDRLLAELGAFDAGRPRYFRHPFGDLGQAAERAAIASGLTALGYRVAGVTLNLHDYCYDGPWLLADAAHRRRQVEGRFLRSARREMARSQRQGAARAQVAACHFGPVTEHCLARFLAQWGSSAQWVDLATALSSLNHGASAGSQQDPFAPRALGPAERVLRKVLRTGRRLGLRSRWGPRWPHLAQ